MYPRNIDNYGSAKVDSAPVANPETELPAAAHNRTIEDLAQLTRTGARVFFSFATTTTAAPVAVSAIDCATVWGDGVGSSPAIQKTATGTYVATFQTTYQDGLAGTIADAESETETVNFRFRAGGGVRGSTRGDIQLDLASNVVTVYVFNAAGALSDLGGSITVDVGVR